MTRRELLFATASLPLFAASRAHFSFWVFGLLRPVRLQISGYPSARLHCRTNKRRWILEPGCREVIDPRSTPLRITGPDEAPAAFVLEVPGMLSREFYGTLRIDARGSILIPVITMESETAVGSIIGAELPVRIAPLQAMMAQAVLARSFLAGTTSARHNEACFCDTTHCQFLRAPALPGSAAARATSQTAGCVLSQAEIPFPASYSAACGGRTEGGERDGHAYTSVACAVCRTQHLTRRGHGWGLCQEGAMGLARQGLNWRQILACYFPEASLRYV